MELTSKETTSEEKLLKLIRKKNNAPLSARSGGPAAARQGPGRPGPRVDLWAVAPRVLMTAVLGLAVYGVVQYVTFTPAPIAAVPEAGEPEETADVLPQAAAQERSFDTYKESMPARDIFQAPWEKPAAGAASAGASALELAKNLKVVGILLDADPKAIIEDAAMKQTFFVSPGERVGGAILEEIRQDRVILIFNEERVELVP